MMKKTTVEINKNLKRKHKAWRSLRGLTLKDWVENKMREDLEGSIIGGSQVAKEFQKYGIWGKDDRLKGKEPEEYRE